MQLGLPVEINVARASAMCTECAQRIDSGDALDNVHLQTTAMYYNCGRSTGAKIWLVAKRAVCSRTLLGICFSQCLVFAYPPHVSQPPSNENIYAKNRDVRLLHKDKIAMLIES